MEQRLLGGTGKTVSAVGLGLMGMSAFYGPTDRKESIRTIHQALDEGVTILDTGDFYAMGHNELLLGEALQGRKRDEAFISVKFGAQRSPDGAFVGYDARPQALKSFLSYTLVRLGVDYIDLYQPARLDPAVPIEETVGAIGEMIDKGYVRHVGLSEVGSQTLRRASAVHPIAWLQIEYSLISRGIEDSVLPTARELDIAVNPYGVLSRGLLSGNWSKERSQGGGGLRSHMPRFGGDNLEHNLDIVERLRRIANEKRITVAQLAIAWVMAQGKDIIPLIGARTRGQLNDALSAMAVSLTAEDLAAIEAAVPKGSAAGERYAPEHMKALDSEKG
ncbi:MAG TPA: aldo/keto reductase [Alphaproteobacteria bacterium]|nr:aldo/keto reductase [Alphaproteobacteria bacterium]